MYAEAGSVQCSIIIYEKTSKISHAKSLSKLLKKNEIKQSLGLRNLSKANTKHTQNDRRYVINRDGRNLFGNALYYCKECQLTLSTFLVRVCHSNDLKKYAYIFIIWVSYNRAVLIMANIGSN